MWSLFIEPFWEFEFLRRALFESWLLSFSFAVIGVVLITRRLALIGDTLSHAMLPGVVIAFLIFGEGFRALFIGGWVTGTLLLTVAFFLFRRRQVGMDAALALFAVFSVALGVLLASKTQTSTEILHLLFGNILAVDPSLLVVSVVVGVVTVGGFLLGYRSVLIALVDPEFFARAGGRSTGFSLALLALFAANLTLGFAALGAMMTVGLLIVPALAGRQFGSSLLGQVGSAAIVGVLASWWGLVLSYHAEVPAGPAIVAVACMEFFVLWMVRGRWRT